MAKPLLVKLLLIGALLLLLLVPLGLLDGLVAERQQRGHEVAADIARSVGGAQTVVGPLLLIEALQQQRVEQTVNENGYLRQVTESRPQALRRLVPPSRLEVEAQLDGERRGRGPFEALLYHSEQTLQARFRMPALPADAVETGYRITAVHLLLALGDHRGIRALSVELDDELLAVTPGSRLDWQPQGVSATLARTPAAGQDLKVTAKLLLSGSARLAWLPVGDENQLALRSDWPHPGFEGSPLPRAHRIDEAGFSAEWQVSRLASNAQQWLQRCDAHPAACGGLDDDSVAVRLVEPVDRYRMTDRAIKYALLFLTLIFGAVFFVEVLRGVVVHPMQYALVGLALAMFFLLLLALAEQIGFGLAYAVAALACLALISVYMTAVLGSRRRGGGFALLLVVLYGLLYSLLLSEDLALLAGSLALFGLLATVMLASRHVDWRRVGAGAG
jgi:inner membrane protein